MVQNYVFSRPGKAIPRKKLLPFGNFLQPESKSFEVFFLGGFLLDNMWEEGGGEHIPIEVSFG